MAHPELEIRWTDRTLRNGGFINKAKKVLRSVPNYQAIIRGTGVAVGQLDTKPAAVLGKVLTFFGLKTKEDGRPRIGGEKVYVRGLDLDAWKKSMDLAQRANRRSRGLPVPHFDDLEPLEAAIEMGEVIDITDLLDGLLDKTGTDG